MTITLPRVALPAILLLALSSCAPPSRSLSASANRALLAEDASLYTRLHYTKTESLVPMRDGVKLFTAIYAPRDASTTYPILLVRTPYSCRPYGPEEFRSVLGPNRSFDEAGFIFVFQDVRGRYMSEGEFVDMRPHNPDKHSPSDVDESSDTHDAIDWLLANVPNHNGRVGMWGISYPGFYSSAGMIDAHPALKAVSPQAPIADWWFDDFFHHGAFFLPHNFNFFASFGRPRPEPTTESPPRFDHKTPDGYQFFLDLGPLSNVNDKHFNNDVPFWNEILEHPTYDHFWQSRNILPNLKNTAPASLVVGGLFDAEDLYGAWNTYSAIEKQNPSTDNRLVMGPWFHGGWSRSDGDHLGPVSFDAKTSLWYREHIELPFFRHHLKDAPAPDIAEATVFNTGANVWRTFDQWPPADGEPVSLYLHPASTLSFDAPPDSSDRADEFISDPAKPVPFIEDVSRGMTREYMTADQRFAARRPDVLVYQTPPLDEDITLAGPVLADLIVSTSQSDADWVVKLIDVFPADTPDNAFTPKHSSMGNYHMLVRSEAFRGRFRNSYSKPEPFTPNEPTRVTVPLQDLLHTFKKGHRIQVQIQSTWFPLIDRNPQKYVDNIFKADASDFTPATHRVYHAPDLPSRLRVTRLHTPQSPAPAPN